MILVAGGDSFVYGTELADQLPGTHVPSKSTFPALLANNYNLEYLCTAQTGNSNSAIARQVINACNQYLEQKLFVHVTWTFSCRYEFYFNQQVRTSNWYSLTPWDSHDTMDEILHIVKSDQVIAKHHTDHFAKLNQTELGKFAKIFYKNIGDNELYETYSSVKEMLFLQQYLDSNQIPYMFTCADTNMFYNQSQQDLNVVNLNKQINFDKWFLFEPAHEPWNTTTPRGFYQWAVENKYPIGTTHPLEQAHQAAAELMKDKFNELVKKSL